MAERIGEMLLRSKLLNHDQLDKALREQVQTGEFLGEIMIRLGFVKEDELLHVLAKQFNTRYVSLDKVAINPQVIKLVPIDLVEEHLFVPIEMRSAVLLIAVANPLDMWPMSVLQKRLNISEVQIVLATKEDIKKAVQKYYK